MSSASTFQLSAALLALFAVAETRQLTCKARDLPAINVDGLRITNLHAEEHKDWSDWQHSEGQPFKSVSGPISYCSLTVTYTHPGLNDSLNVYIGLPSSRDNWNGRYLGLGGGGWLAGTLDAIPGAVSAGYAAAATDAGHGIRFPEDVANAEPWSMRSKGNTDWNALQNFASRSLDDLPKIAKQVIEGFYGEAATHSYWVGCSTGGRQGLMSAQRYPENYDGIVAVAPAINWASFLIAELWPQVLMNEARYWPAPCEYEAIRQEALKACAEKVGTDAMGYDDCDFDATSVVGNGYDCFGDSRKISKQAAELANGIWKGPVRNGRQEWFGVMYQMPFGGYDDPSPFSGLAITTCDDNNENCKGWPFVMSHSWAKDFLMRDLDWDIGTLDEAMFWKLLHSSRNQYESIMSTNDPDLSEFKARGGKILGWHGLADQVIFPQGSRQYYNRVMEHDPDVHSFYRFFEVPSVLHCSGGTGHQPTNPLAAVVKWVEEGVAPGTLLAEDDETGEQRRLGPYPEVAVFTGGDRGDEGSWKVVSREKARGMSVGHDEL